MLAPMPKNHEVLTAQEAERRFFTPKPPTTLAPPVAPRTNYDSFVPFNFFTHPDRQMPEKAKFPIGILELIKK